MKVDIPKDEYIKKIEVNDDNLDIQFDKRKKVALLFISLNPNYWPYLAQVIEDCKTNFLPQHKVDYFVWTDIPEKGSSRVQEVLDGLPTQEQNDESVKNGFGMRLFSKEVISETLEKMWKTENLTTIETEGIEWPAPTLMRYHLFLQKAEELKDYDYVFYLDADMRVVDKISDEILVDGLLAAEHPMYSLAPRYIPPYEPNEKSTAFIKRPGRVVDENGRPRFKPYYIAGGFQGGTSGAFIKAMQAMKKNIDTDFDKLNYTAIWNDESHWNKYVFDMYDGPLTVLGPEYIYPDSLIKEYYEPTWGRSLKPKIITLTKPFSLSKEGGDNLNQMLGRKPAEDFSVICPQCRDKFEVPNHKVKRILSCPGSGKAHQCDLEKI